MWKFHKFLKHQAAFLTTSPPCAVPPGYKVPKPLATAAANRKKEVTRQRKCFNSYLSIFLCVEPELLEDLEGLTDSGPLLLSLKIRSQHPFRK